MPSPAEFRHNGALPSPQRRNWVWFNIQMVLRVFFVEWLGYRARGHEKLPRDGGALLLINHQSHLDPLLVGLPLQRPISYIARHNLFPVPVVGWILRNTYVMAINQDQPGASVIREAVRRLEHGFLVGIFPEGSRTNDGEVAELKPGFAMLLRRAHVPVYPVGVAGAFEVFPRGSVVIKPGRVRVVFGDPFPPQQLRELCQRGREPELIHLVRSRIIQCQRDAERWRRRSR
ncbi:MAG TPA: 1-acyl-sn-glycerol-3-phosphate acyltransferase [Planctomycetaceae bacterium]|nr:1-acyl-sn-glycerol-3-phosphate acyltransferase [Planctomycetaceae bacterium]